MIVYPGSFWANWLRTLALGAVAIALAVVATRDAIVQSTARARPEVALGIDGTNAIALNSDFKSRLAAQPDAPIPVSQWAERARAALLTTPLSTPMLRMVSAAPGHKQPQETLHLAERLSRRDALTQLALIETAVNAGKVDAALVHYDHALSIYPDMRSLLFPILTNGIREPEIQQGVIALARQQRPWINAFFTFAVQSTDAPEAMARTLAALDHGPGALPNAHTHEAVLAKKLADTGQYALARRIAMRAAGDDAAAIDRPGISPATWAQATRPLTWSPTEDDSINAQLETDDSLSISILPGRSGLAIFRMLVLAPGSYRFAAGMTTPQDLIAAHGQWGFICLRAAGEPGFSLATVPANPDKAASTALVTVPKECAAVRMDFTIDNINGSSEAGVLLHDVSLSPAH